MEEERKKTPKQNGFEQPYDELQILSWILFPAFVVFWFLAILPVLSAPLNIILTVVFTGIFVTVIVYAYKTIVSNPMDRYQHYSTDLIYDVNPKHCYICDRDVFPLSLHCRICRKCVDGFDHHCKWLNTCIGRHNYKIFYVTLSSATYLVVFEVIVEICLIVLYIINKESLAQKLSSFYNTSSSNIDGWFVSLCIMTALMVPVCILLVQLWTFHVALIRDKTTTYAYLRNLQQEKAEKMRKLRLGIKDDNKKKDGRKKKSSRKNNDDKGGAGAVYPADYNGNGNDNTGHYRGLFESIFFCASNDRSNLMHLPFEDDKIVDDNKQKSVVEASDTNIATTAVVSTDDIRLPERVDKTTTV